MKAHLGAGWVFSLVLALFLVLGLALQTMRPALAQEPAETQQLDYAAWDRFASGLEAEMASGDVVDKRLEELRGDLVTWRTSFSAGQTINTTRIATVRDQLAALGAVPEGGAAEPAEIASKRKELNGQLAELQAPAISAEEAYRRADGLIREIDGILRDRQANNLLQLSPSPLNPGNWPEAVVGVSDTLMRMWREVADRSSYGFARNQFFNNLPIILLLLGVTVATIVFARAWFEAFSDRLSRGSTLVRRRIFALLASLGQVVVPTVGVMALSAALTRTGFLGRLSASVVEALPFLGFILFTSIWLGGRAFPKVDDMATSLPLVPERRAEGRFLAAMMGAVLVVAGLRQVAMAPQNYSEAVSAVTAYPLICAAGFLLWRMGRILRQSRAAEGSGNYGQTLLNLLGRVLAVIGCVGPLLASFGYISAAQALVYPAIGTLGLLTVVLIVQRLLSDLWAVIYPANDDTQDQGLVPVLLGFALALLSLPLFAMIWGTRSSELLELWARFGEGFQLGATRISPTDFLVFALIFGLGYLVTRLLQGALRNTILPRTKIDLGGQNALVSGAGYVGIFLAALISINATGIDLSGLAIVASALSVGIGFGMQNIVQNFVSGVILMIERPVSEGDWIEVGTTQGIVKTISVRSTRIQTFDRNMVVVPNADLVSQRVTNWTRFGLAGRLIVPVTVNWSEDSREIERVLLEVAEAQPMVVLNPAPMVVFTGFTAGALNFEIRVILRDVNFGTSVRSDINHMLVERFKTLEVALPLSSTEVNIRRPEARHAAKPDDKAEEGPAKRRRSAVKPAGPASEETT